MDGTFLTLERSRRSMLDAVVGLGHEGSRAMLEFFDAAQMKVWEGSGDKVMGYRDGMAVVDSNLTANVRTVYLF